MTDQTSEIYQITAPAASMRALPDANAECTSEYLYGEVVKLATPHAGKKPSNTKPPNTDTSADVWLGVAAERDGYTGYMHSSDLQITGADTPTSTHWVSARSTLMFSQASIKSRVIMRLPFLARVVATPANHSDFVKLDTGGYLWHQHLLAIDQCAHQSAIELAQSHFLSAPYLWGGCSPEGLDCSGLIQALAQAKNIRIPRDSGDQERELTDTVDVGEYRAQDIVYWPGHTGILLDSHTILHATAHCLSCVEEPLQDVIKRAGPISSVKRLFG